MPTAGQVIRAVDFAGHAYAQERSALVLSSSSFEATSTPCSATFVAPTSGRVWINFSVRWDAAAVSDQMEADVEVREDDSSGTVVHSPETVSDGTIDFESNSSSSATHNNANGWRYLEGLTAGSTYYVELQMNTDSTSFDIEEQTLLVQPLP